MKYLPDERDWVHLERQWICDVLYTVDTNSIQNMIDDAILQRHQRIESQQNLTIQIKPEFAQALEQCQQFSRKFQFSLIIQSLDDKGRSVFLLKDTSRRKRTREELEEVKREENVLKENKQEFLREYKRLKKDKIEMQSQLLQLNNSQEIVNQLIDAGILNEEGQINLQQQQIFDI